MFDTLFIGILAKQLYSCPPPLIYHTLTVPAGSASINIVEISIKDTLKDEYHSIYLISGLSII